MPELVEPLIELAGLPNVFAFWSEDRDSGASDLPVGRRCFLCTTPQDEPLVPPGVLVFRKDVRASRKFIDSSWVCPKEQGTKASITCSECLRCVSPDPWPVAPERRGRDGSASSSPGMKVGSA